MKNQQYRLSVTVGQTVVMPGAGYAPATPVAALHANDNAAYGISLGFHSYYLKEPKPPIISATDGDYQDRIVISWEVENDSTAAPVTGDKVTLYAIKGIYYGQGTTFTATPYKETPIGRSLRFDGVDDYLSFPQKRIDLTGGLSLGLSGFGFWSHDIGGFEQTASADVYKRWCAFGLLSSHSRLHGSSSYRVPWLYDEGAVEVLRFFTRLKCRLMSYLFGAACQAREEGVPVMRAMVLEFSEDPGCVHLDRQYMLGETLLVAPVMAGDGTVDFYLPEGWWTHFLSGEVVEGGRWARERHGFTSLPLLRNVTAIAGVEGGSAATVEQGMLIRVDEGKSQLEITLIG